jgi:hypothetical protein
MKKVIIILSAVILFTACKKTDINGTTYYYTGPNQTNNTNSCPIDTAQLVFHPKDTLYTSNPLSGNLQNFSVSFWMKTTQKDSSYGFPDYTFIVDRDIFGIANDWSIGMSNGGKITVHGAQSHTINLISNKDYNDNVYHHVVVTYNPAINKRSLYVDNVLEKSDTTYSNFTFTNIFTPITIGMSGVETSRHKKFIGNLKTVRIYNKPISTCEIQYLYNIKP